MTQSCSVKRKSGFTLTELIVVIVIIGILAAVLIPTFAGYVKKANLSSDQVAVRNMNSVLEADELMNGKPENTTAVKDVLKEAGFNTEYFITVTSGYRFFWDKEKNQVILVNTSTSEAEYPKGASYSVDSDNYLPLDNIPTATVKIKETIDELKVTPCDNNGTSLGFTVTMDSGAVYTCIDDTNTIDTSDYKDYYADFRLTLSKRLTYKGNPTIEDGNVGAMLLGKIGESDFQVLSFSGISGGDPDPTTSYQTNYVMLFMGDPLKYEFVVRAVQKFECGIKMVYDNRYTQSFTEFDNQIMDSEDKKFLDGLTVTVEFILREGYDSNTEMYTGKEIVVNSYSYTYYFDGDTLKIK